MVFALIAAFGGFLYGYDIGVFAGALGALSQSLHLSPWQIGWATASVIVGGLVGSLVAGPVAERWGRRPVMFAVSALYGLGSIGVWRCSGSFESFIAFRILTGIGIGLTTTVCPMYIAEVAPPERRGRWVSLYQLVSVVGLLAVFVLEWAFQSYMSPTETLGRSWRLRFAGGVFPALVFGCGVCFLPETHSRELAHTPPDLVFNASIAKPLMIGMTL